MSRAPFGVNQIGDVIRFFRQLLSSGRCTELHVAAIVAVAEVIRKLNPIAEDMPAASDTRRSSMDIRTASRRRRSVSVGTSVSVRTAEYPTDAECYDCHLCDCVACLCSSPVCSVNVDPVCPLCFDGNCSNVHCEHCPAYTQCWGSVKIVDTQRTAQYVMYALSCAVKTLKRHLLDPTAFDADRKFVNCKVLTALPCFAVLDIYVEHVLKLYSSFVKSENDFFADFKWTVVSLAEPFCNSIYYAKVKVAHQAALFVAPQCRKRAFVTHAWSDSVGKVAQACSVTDNGKWTLFVSTLEMTSSEISSLKETISVMSTASLDVRVVADTQVASVLELADAVLIGAEVVTWEGGVINRLGAKNLCQGANVAMIPVYVASPSYKFFRVQLQANDAFYEKGLTIWHSEPFGIRERNQEVIETLAPDERPVWQTSLDASLARNIPPGMIDLVITDMRPLPPSGVVDEMSRFLFGEAGVDGAGLERDWRQVEYGWDQ